jgi:transaldolase
VSRTVDQGVDQARAELDALAAAGIDMAKVSAQLEDEGVAGFSKSYDELLQALEDKANEMRANAEGGTEPKASPKP